MDDIEPGEDITGSEDAGEPDADVAPRVFGRMHGRIWVADDFDAPLPDDILDSFYNGPLETDE